MNTGMFITNLILATTLRIVSAMHGVEKDS